MSDHAHPVAANLLDRQFEADTPNQGGASGDMEGQVPCTRG